MSGAGYPVRLAQAKAGAFYARAGGYNFEALLLDGVWAVFVDGYEIFSAARLETAERKIEDWLAERG